MATSARIFGSWGRLKSLFRAGGDWVNRDTTLDTVQQALARGNGRNLGHLAGCLDFNDNYLP